MDCVYVLEGYYGHWGELGIFKTEAAANETLDRLNERYGTSITRRVRTVYLHD